MFTFQKVREENKMNYSGIYSNLSNAEYHAHPHVGSTTLARARRSWAHAVRPFESTDAMRLGSGFHALVGEPALFSRLFVKSPKFDRRTTIGKQASLEFEMAHQGKTILSEDDYAAMDGMLSSILNHKLALSCLTGGVSEISAFTIDEESGVGVKSRPDYFRNSSVIVDIKTAVDGSIDSFQRTLLPYGRHIQTALYLDVMSAVTGQKLDDLIHLVVEKEPPYAISVYALDDSSIEQGRREYKALLKSLAMCRQINEFPAYPETVQTVSIPERGFKYE